MFNYNISHFHPIPFKYGKSSNLTRCRLSDDLWAEKRRAQGKKPKHSDHANVSLPPIHPLSWHYSTSIHSVPLAVHGNVAHVSLGSNFPPPPLSARYRLGRTKRRQHQNQAAVSWPPPLSLYNQPRRRFMHTQTHTHTVKLAGAKGRGEWLLLMLLHRHMLSCDGPKDLSTSAVSNFNIAHGHAHSSAWDPFCGKDKGALGWERGKGSPGGWNPWRAG